MPTRRSTDVRAKVTYLLHDRLRGQFRLQDVGGVVAVVTIASVDRIYILIRIVRQVAPQRIRTLGQSETTIRLHVSFATETRRNAKDKQSGTLVSAFLSPNCR